MKNQALFSSKDNSKKLKCCLLQFLFGSLKVNTICIYQSIFFLFLKLCKVIIKLDYINSLPSALTLKVQKKKIAADVILIFFFYLLKKIRLDFSCASTAKQRIHLKHRVLFSLKNNEKIFMNVVCCSHNWGFKG